MRRFGEMVLICAASLELRRRRAQKKSACRADADTLHCLTTAVVADNPASHGSEGCACKRGARATGSRRRVRVAGPTAGRDVGVVVASFAREGSGQKARARSDSDSLRRAPIAVVTDDSADDTAQEGSSDRFG